VACCECAGRRDLGRDECGVLGSASCGEAARFLAHVLEAVVVDAVFEEVNKVSAYWRVQKGLRDATGQSQVRFVRELRHASHPSTMYPCDVQVEFDEPIEQVVRVGVASATGVAFASPAATPSRGIERSISDRSLTGPVAATAALFSCRPGWAPIDVFAGAAAITRTVVSPLDGTDSSSVSSASSPPRPPRPPRVHGLSTACSSIG